jgi:hypothetical protein
LLTFVLYRQTIKITVDTIKMCLRNFAQSLAQQAFEHVFAANGKNLI